VEIAFRRRAVADPAGGDRVSLRMAEAMAQPTAWMNWVPRLPETEKKPCSFEA
jgi:hypothetical protein